MELDYRTYPLEEQAEIQDQAIKYLKRIKHDKLAPCFAAIGLRAEAIKVGCNATLRDISYEMMELEILKRFDPRVVNIRRHINLPLNGIEKKLIELILSDEAIADEWKSVRRNNCNDADRLRNIIENRLFIGANARNILIMRATMESVDWQNIIVHIDKN